MASKRERKKKPSETTPAEEPQVVGFLGVGFDHKDGHHRRTQCDNFFLVGGSEETHERMQDTAVRFNEALKRRGKRLENVSFKEIVDLFHEAQD